LKLRLLERFGIDVAVVLAFDAGLAGLSADEFIARILVDALAARQVVVGYDFRFGKGRTGNPEGLRRAGEALDFGVTVIGQGRGSRRGLLLQDRGAVARWDALRDSGAACRCRAWTRTA